MLAGNPDAQPTQYATGFGIEQLGYADVALYVKGFYIEEEQL